MGYYWHISEPFLRIHVFLGILLLIISSHLEYDTIEIAYLVYDDQMKVS